MPPTRASGYSLPSETTAESADMSDAEVIERFIAQYQKEYDYFETVARMVELTLRSDLAAAGVRAIVTSRAKSPMRLKAKCEQRSQSRKYRRVDDIYTDIVDLAGVRVALYFPSDQTEVRKIVESKFHMVRPSKVFPEDDIARSDGKRFTGYHATHYLVKLRPDGSSELERYSKAVVEIQVASVVMHAWAEVEHDLVYKPAEGNLSTDEHQLLDQINGLMLAAEIALERLKEAGSRRVGTDGQPFANHYDLASFLTSRAHALIGEPIADAALGRVDLLFALLSRLGLATPSALEQYVENFDADTERRPVAEQVIDAVLAANEDRYKAFDELRVEMGLGEATPGALSEDQERHAVLGAFLLAWVRLEQVLYESMELQGAARRNPHLRWISRTSYAKLLNPADIDALDVLRRLRNEVVHGVEARSAEELRAATEQLRRLTAALEESGLRARSISGDAAR